MNHDCSTRRNSSGRGASPLLRTPPGDHSLPFTSRRIGFSVRTTHQAAGSVDRLGKRTDDLEPLILEHRRGALCLIAEGPRPSIRSQIGRFRVFF
jgi:hypothetical protein